ncbi:hypothetical protein [Bdellovibrio sp. HCB209]|uniref:hypothetical protein n=1 Tax=Bdellovibrio sp. HCB209 TaxID=3394354 RepID=UPI0039B37BD1
MKNPIATSHKSRLDDAGEFCPEEVIVADIEEPQVLLYSCFLGLAKKVVTKLVLANENK